MTKLTQHAAGALEHLARSLRGSGPNASKVLVLGGARSGKSRHAETLASRHPEVGYVATGPPPDDDDPEWAARVATHRARRPPNWHTIETTDLAAAVRAASAPLLIDCLGTWLGRVLDDSGAWESASESAQLVDQRLGDFLDAWQKATVPLIAVSNEVGSGVVPATTSGRLFRDVLGALNSRVAARSDRVSLLVAGRVLELGGSATSWTR